MDKLTQSQLEKEKTMVSKTDKMGSSVDKLTKSQLEKEQDGIQRGQADQVPVGEGEDHGEQDGLQRGQADQVPSGEDQTLEEALRKLSGLQETQLWSLFTLQRHEEFRRRRQAKTILQDEKV